MKTLIQLILAAGLVSVVLDKQPLEPPNRKGLRKERALADVGGTVVAGEGAHDHHP